MDQEDAGQRRPAFSDRAYPIPATLNLAIAALVVVSLTTLLALGGVVQSWYGLLALSFGYGLLMNSGYAVLHEAQHRMLHPNRRLNDWVGIVVSLFFPASFHLLKQGHIGHHMRNRSDDEAFDFYFEGDNPLLKFLQFYGIMTGMFWLVIVASNFIALFAPGVFKSNRFSLDRPTEALLESLNPKYVPFIRREAVAVFVLHSFLIWFFSIPIVSHSVILAGFGVMWSTMQYVHHFGTERHVTRGAKNLKNVGWLEIVWLNQNWHLAHHQHPTVPWIHLPKLPDSEHESRDSLMKSYIKMWRGPRLTRERVENKFSGKIIR